MDEMRDVIPLDINEQPSEALRHFYETLPGGVVQELERHRLGILRDTLAHLNAARDLLAPFGGFKAWCEAAGIGSKVANYRLNKTNWAPRPVPGSADDPYGSYRRMMGAVSDPDLTTSGVAEVDKRLADLRDRLEAQPDEVPAPLTTREALDLADENQQLHRTVRSYAARLSQAAESERLGIPAATRQRDQAAVRNLLGDESPPISRDAAVQAARKLYHALLCSEGDSPAFWQEWRDLYGSSGAEGQALIVQRAQWLASDPY